MKICEKCSVEIINGVNGCVMQGNVCDECAGHPRFDMAPPRRYTDIPEDYVNYIESCFLHDAE